MTDRCVNITFPQLRFRAVKNPQSVRAPTSCTLCVRVRMTSLRHTYHPAGTSVNSDRFSAFQSILTVFYNCGLWENMFGSIQKQPRHLSQKLFYNGQSQATFEFFQYRLDTVNSIYLKSVTSAQIKHGINLQKVQSSVKTVYHRPQTKFGAR